MARLLNILVQRMVHLLADDPNYHQSIKTNADHLRNTEVKVVDNVFIIIFSCLGFMILLSVYMLITL